MKNTGKNNTEDINTQSTIASTTLIGAAIQAIIGYIAVWFFKPIWERVTKYIIKWWKRNDES